MHIQIEFFTLFTIFTNNVKSGFFSNSLKIPNDQKTNYGIGWRIRYDNENNTYLGHTGGSVGGTTFVFSTEDKSVISIMANISNASFGTLPYELFKIFKN